MAVDKQDKLMEYLEFFWSQVNIPRVRRALRRAGLWDELDFLTFLTQKESRMKDSMWWFREQQGRKRKRYPQCSSPIPNINDSMNNESFHFKVD